MKKILLSAIAALAMSGVAYAGDGTAASPFTVTEALAYIANGGSEDATMYAQGYITSITEVSTDYGNATYAIADAQGGSPTLGVYRGYYFNGDKFTNVNQIKVNDLVVVEGKLVNYKGNTPQFTTGSKIISINGETSGTDDPGTDDPGTDDPATPTGESVTFDFSNPANFGFNPDDAVESALDLTGKTLESNGVKIYCEGEGAQTPIRLYLSTAGKWSFRFYKGTQFTVTAPEGYNLSGIEFAGNNIGTDWTYSNGALSGKTWTPSGDVTSVTIGKSATGNNPTIDSMKVYYTADAGVAEILAADDSQAVYYNLQGQKVANPERGIFVKVVNGKALKVVK